MAIFAGKLSCSDVASIYDASCQPAIGPFTGLNATASSTDQRCIRDRGEVECRDLFPAANAVDGTLNTPWRSATLTGSVRVSITLDLGVEQNVSQVTLYPEAGYVAASYQINVSLDNANWTTVASMAGEGAGNPQTDPWVNLRDTFK